MNYYVAYPIRWKRTPAQNDDPEDRGFEKTEKEKAKEWVNPVGDGTTKIP